MLKMFFAFCQGHSSKEKEQPFKKASNKITNTTNIAMRKIFLERLKNVAYRKYV